MDWAEFGALWLLNFFNLISPGPETALMIRNSSRFSRRVGLATGFGIVSSTIIHKTYSILGFGLFVSNRSWIFNILKILASAYLIYLGIKAFLPKKNSEGKHTFKSPVHLSEKDAFKMGFTMDIVHPSASLVFISILTKTVSPSTPLQIQALYGALLVLTSISWYCLQSYVFSHGRFKKTFEKYGYVIDWMTGIVFIIYGIKLML